MEGLSNGVAGQKTRYETSAEAIIGRSDRGKSFLEESSERIAPEERTE